MHTDTSTYMFVGGLCDVVLKVIVWFLLAAQLRVGAQQFVVVGLQQVQHGVSLKVGGA